MWADFIDASVYPGWCLILEVFNQYSGVLKNKIQPSKFEDLIGFIQQFMSRAASHLERRKALWEVVQNGRFYRRREGGTEVTRLDSFRQGYRPLKRNGVSGRLPHWPGDSWLTGLNSTPGRGWNCSSFRYEVLVGLSTSNSILGLLFLFNGSVTHGTSGWPRV